MILSRTTVNLSGILLFLLLFSGACKVSSPLYFTEPQPAGMKNKTSFKKKYLGTYVCDKDSMEITVTRDAVLRHIRYRNVVSRGTIDTMGLELRDGYIYYSRGEKTDSFPVIVAGDSVQVDYEKRDTLFQVSGKDLLRYYKKKYFLNTPGGWQGWWTVRTLGFETGYSHNGTDKERLLVIHRFYKIKEKKGYVGYLLYGSEIKTVDMGIAGKAVAPTKKQLESMMDTRAYRIEYKCTKLPRH